MNGAVPDQRVRVVTTSGRLLVTVCPLCAALVVDDGIEQHARVHALGLRDAQDGPVRPAE